MIAHIDADSFFASVLIRKDPRLRGKPLLALGMGGGCVIAATYEAKAKGVKTGMRLSDALKLVPEAIRLPSDFRETGLASDQIETILRDNCPIVQQYSIDEWFLDLKSIVGGTPADLTLWATQISQTIRRRTGISVSTGIGPSKILAKMASEYRKPAGVSTVGTNAELTIPLFLQDRPVAAIPGIGQRNSLHAEVHDIRTAWDFARANPTLLKQVFHKPGLELQRELLGECLSPVITESAPPKSVSRARSFPPLQDRATLWAHILRHLEYTILKIRRHELGCRGISVWLRNDTYADYRSSHASLPRLMDTEEAIRPFAESCFHQLYKPGKGYTQAGLSLWNLKPSAMQYSLFEDPKQTEEEESLQETLDDIHERFGRDAVTRASALKVKSGTKRGFEMPIVESGGVF